MRLHLTLLAPPVSNQDSNEQQFTIQPHPAKSNNPQEATPGLGSAPNLAHLSQAADPTKAKPFFVAQGLEQPKSAEELKAAQAELNK